MAEYAKRGYLLENFRLFHLRSEQGETVDYHYHEFCKLLLLVSGKGNYVVDGQRYILQPGDAVLIGSRSVHRPELEAGTAYERIIIYIAPEFLEKASTEDCNLTEIFSDRRGPILRMKESRRRRIFTMAAELEEELSTDAYGREILSSSALLRLLVELGRNLRQTDSQKPETKHWQPVAGSRQQINKKGEQPCSPFSIPSLSPINSRLIASLLTIHLVEYTFVFTLLSDDIATTSVSLKVFGLVFITSPPLTFLEYNIQRLAEISIYIPIALFACLIIASFDSLSIPYIYINI